MRDELDIPMPRMAPAEPAYRLTNRREPADSGTKRLALVGGGVAGVLLLIGGAWALSGHHRSVVPVVMADSRPLRTRPENPGGLQVQGQDDAILSGAADSQDALAPPPEVPAPQVLKQEAQRELADKQAIVAAATPEPAAAPEPAAGAAPQPAAAARPAAVPAPVAQSVAPAAAPPPQAKPAAAATPVPSEPDGHAQVQLAAVGSEAAALLEWQRLLHRMPGLLDGKQPAVSRSERSGRTYFRLRTGGFADIAQATAFCEAVRAKGSGCILASF